MDRILITLFLLVAIATPGTVVFLPASSVIGPVAAILAGLIISGLSLYFSILCVRRRYIESLVRFLPAEPFSNMQFAVVVGIGLLLRIAFCVLYHAEPESDGATYLSLAATFVENRPYVDGRGEYAYWPPGYPMVLAAFITIFGKQAWIVAFSNCVFFVITATAVRSIARRISCDRAAIIATFVLTVWPNLIVSTGTASKELLAMALLAGAGALYLKAVHAACGYWPVSLATGLTIGLAALTQPALMLFPFVFAAHLFIRRTPVRRMLLIVVLILIGTVVSIAPWTYRNQTIFGTFVPIATNGGDVFYRANNPLATGGYIDKGEVELRKYGEIERGKVGNALATQWIRDHPWDFARLAVNKLAMYQGDDAHGAYWAIKRALGVEGLHYALFKGISNLFWIVFWLAILVLLLRKNGEASRSDLTLIFIGYLYLVAIDCVFESGGRHHMVLVGWLAALFGILLETAALKHRQGPVGSVPLSK